MLPAVGHAQSAEGEVGVVNEKPHTDRYVKTKHKWIYFATSRLKLDKYESESDIVSVDDRRLQYDEMFPAIISPVLHFAKAELSYPPDRILGENNYPSLFRPENPSDTFVMDDLEVWKSDSDWGNWLSTIKSGYRDEYSEKDYVLYVHGFNTPTFRGCSRDGAT